MANNSQVDKWHVTNGMDCLAFKTATTEQVAFNWLKKCRMYFVVYQLSLQRKY